MADQTFTNSTGFVLTVRGTVASGQVTADLRPETIVEQGGALMSDVLALVVPVPSTLSADSGHGGVVAPVTGTIVGADLWNSAEVAGGNLRVTLQVDGQNATGGLMTLTVGSPSGTVAGCDPVGAAVVFRQSVVGAMVSGSNTAAGHGTVTVYIRPAATN